MAPLQYGLNFTKKKDSNGGVSSSSSKPSPAKRKTIFDDSDKDDDDDDTTNADPQSKHDITQEINTFDDSTSFAPTNTTVPPPPSSIKSKETPSLSSRRLDLASRLSHTKRTTEATSLDPSIYDYDAAYDIQHAAEKKRKENKRENAEERRSKYMADLLAAAEVRKRDQTRARDRLVQKEREAEGEEFKDKEAFVTEAYKAQQEETQRLQEEEKARAEREDKLRKSGRGMTGFYKNLMADEDQRRQELLHDMQSVAKDAATATGPSMSASAGDSTTTAPPSRDQSQAELARRLREQGKDVILTDDGQVADKRQLLNAGLNVARKQHPADSHSGAAVPKQFSQSASQDRATAASKSSSSSSSRDAQRAQRERQSRMLEHQLEQATKRAAEQEDEEQLKMERAAKSRKTGADVSSAKERYLQRKKEAAALAAKGPAG